MRIVRKQEMKSIDKRGIEEYKIPSLILMENAGRGVAETIEDYFDTEELSVLCVCGKGNNGGDGFVVARHLANSGADVEILLMSRIEDLAGDALTNAIIARNMGLTVYEITDEATLAEVSEVLDNYGVVVDAILGTGFKGKPEGLTSRIINLVNDCGAFVVSIDLPSGIEADGMGNEPETAVQADLTVTMAYLKPCHLLYPTRHYCGDVWVADISIPNTIIDPQGDLGLFTADEAALQIPDRIAWGNKASFGKILIVAGSRGMSGAARLTAMAASRAGAGLTYLGFPETMADVFDATLLETVKLALPDTGDGHLSASAAKEIMEMADEIKLLAIGPGLGTHHETIELVKILLKNWKKPMIVDADAVNALATEPALLEGKNPALLLTPHPGEMARLINGNSREIDCRRLEICEKYARKWGVVLTLKGAPTITCCPAETWINSTGNSGLASGGTGDVLTGIIAGLAAQGLALSPAARLGVWLHGHAADLAVEDIGEHSLVAGDILDYLPDAFLTVFEDKHGNEHEQWEEE